MSLPRRWWEEAGLARRAVSAADAANRREDELLQRRFWCEAKYQRIAEARAAWMLWIDTMEIGRTDDLRALSARPVGARLRGDCGCPLRGLDACPWPDRNPPAPGCIARGRG